MKVFKIIVAGFIISFLGMNTNLVAQQNTKNPVQPPKILNASDTVQYSIGAYLGKWMQSNGFSLINKDVFRRGMDDALQNKKLAVPDTLIAPLVASYQLSLQNARSQAMENQLFSSLKGKTGIGALPNGVHYIVVKDGTGIRPAVNDTVVFNAIGVFPDGTVFEDTFRKKQPVTTPINRLIPGLSEAVQLMPEGSVWRIFVPSVLGYGPAGLPNIVPPNMALVFELTLIEIRRGK